MGRRRPRFNEKARASSRPATALPHPQPRDSRDKEVPTVSDQVDDIVEVEPVKMSSKKRKRMEKFIEKQLKKEERVKLLEKLR